MTRAFLARPALPRFSITVSNSEGEWRDSARALRLAQSALDGGERSRGRDSPADVLQAREQRLERAFVVDATGVLDALGHPPLQPLQAPLGNGRR